MSRERKTDPVVEQIERDAARQAQAAREAYASRMKLLRQDFSKHQREIATQEKTELKRIERWRATAVAAVEGRPVPLDDVRSVAPDESGERSPGAVRQARYVARQALRAVS